MASTQKDTHTLPKSQHVFQNTSALPIARATDTSLIRNRSHLKKRDVKARFVLMAILLTLLVGVGAVTFALKPWIPASATIMITPQVSLEQQTMTLLAATGTPAPGQVHARFITGTATQQATPAPATGAYQQPALVAHGTITFANLASYAQSVPAGSILTTQDGIQVTTLEQAVVPAAVGIPPTQGKVTVAAQATQTGTIGNIPANAIHQECCTGNLINGIYSVNLQAFVGGQDAATSTVVQQYDIDHAAAPLIQPVTQQALAAFSGQITSDEQEVAGSSQCTPTTQADHPVGSRASQVTVSVSVTCREEVYNQREARQFSQTLFANQVQTILGAAYKLAGPTKVDATQVSVKDAKQGTLTLSIPVRGLWYYQVSQATLQQTLSQIAGKQRADAETVLKQVPGVAQVQMTGNFGNVLPGDHITFTIQVPSSSSFK